LKKTDAAAIVGAMRCLATFALGALLAAGAAARADEAITVFAPSSLTDVVGEIGEAFAAAGHPRPAFSVGATSELAREVLAGAPADVFISADADWMDRLAARGAIDGGTRVDIARNRMVCVVPRGATPVAETLADLAAARYRRIAVAGETVPAGKYARAALEKAGVLAAVSARLVSMPTVRATLALVERGEADAGLVYATDAIAAKRRVECAFDVPADAHPPIVYPAAVVRESKHRAEARAFLELLRGPKARAILEKAGFEVPR
jgi:molybdate transport system substrate-binding protein